MTLPVVTYNSILDPGIALGSLGGWLSIILRVSKCHGLTVAQPAQNFPEFAQNLWELYVQPKKLCI